MLNDRNRRTAEAHNLTALVDSLQTALLALDGVEDVDFDLDGFYDRMPYVILVPKYVLDVRLPDYYARRRAILRSILDVAATHGLTRTDDSIEDYGEHFYIVTQLKNWTEE